MVFRGNGRRRTVRPRAEGEEDALVAGEQIGKAVAVEVRRVQGPDGGEDGPAIRVGDLRVERERDRAVERAVAVTREDRQAVRALDELAPAGAAMGVGV